MASEPGSSGSEVGHVHQDVSGGWLRPAVFGAMDGLVTNIALVAGVGGGGARAHVIVLTGMAGLVAGAFSMALGEYASVQAQNDLVHANPSLALRVHINQELTGLLTGAGGLFLAGVLAARFTARSWWRAGLRQVGFGVIAAVAAYLVGAVIGVGAG